MEIIDSCIFTNSEAISGCTQMDQIQKIIEEGCEGGSNPIRFFQIKIIRMGKAKQERMSKVLLEEELMIQFHDISLRIQGQFHQVERKYLAIMNSTVSHEMRNPLNSIMMHT